MIVLFSFFINFHKKNIYNYIEGTQLVVCIWRGNFSLGINVDITLKIISPRRHSWWKLILAHGMFD